MTTATVLSGRPLVRDLPDGRWELEEDLVIDLGVHLPELHAWQSERLASPVDPPRWVRLSADRGTTVVTVLAGLDTDFSSIPVAAQLLMGPKDRYRLAGAVHDALYRDRAPRRASDDVWWIVARSGPPAVVPWRARLGWLALRLFGRLSHGRTRTA